MKILVLAPSMAGRGGIQRYTANLVRGLVDLLGRENVRSLAVSDTSGRGAHDRFSVRVKVRFVGRVLWQAASWNPDWIICTHIAVGPIGRVAARTVGARYMIVVHGIEAWGSLSRLKEFSLSRADGVIVTSDFSEKQLVKTHQIDPQRIQKLPCMWDDTLLSIDPETDGMLRRIPEGRRVVLTVARMDASERYKGHDVVLQALPSVIAKVPDLIYVMAGDGDDRPRLEKLSTELELKKHVLFLGEISDAELAALYRRSEVFVLPARTVLHERKLKGEGFGIVFLEAMAFGKPVIGPSYGAPQEIIRDGIDGLQAKAEDPTAVANALSHLLAAPEKARQMGDAGSRRVREQYSYGSFRTFLSRILTGTIESGPRSRLDQVWEWLLAIWIVAVNVMYYIQFHTLLGARFNRYHLWR